MTILVLYVLLAIGVSFVCSVLEAVLLSLTPAYIGALQEERPAVARRLGALKEDIDRPLAAILSLNTIAHTVGAAGAGAQAAIVFGSTWVGIFSAALTLGILVLSEIIPKTVGAVYWRQLAPAVSRLLPPLILLLLPLVWLSQWLTRLISPAEKESEVNRDELAAMADIGAEEGVVEGHEAEILKNLLRFNDLQASDILTPRTVVVAFPETATVQEVADAQVPFSRLPVFEGDRDQVTGYVLKDAVLERVAGGEPETPLRELKRDILAVRPELPLPQLFDRLLRRGEHIALVVDEYGGMGGVATMEDVIETLLGLEIVDEGDEITDMQRLARRRWEERAARLGLVVAEEGNQASEAQREERDATIRFGITGGEPPPEEEGS